MNAKMNASKAGVATPENGPHDPIQLHIQAVNSLSRCKAMLIANEPMYVFALDDLAAAQQAITALHALNLSTEA